MDETRKYYDETDKPFAYVDAILLHPGLKKKFMKKAEYSADTIETYVKKAEKNTIRSNQPYAYVDSLNVASAEILPHLTPNHSMEWNAIIYVNQTRWQYHGCTRIMKGISVNVSQTRYGSRAEPCSQTRVREQSWRVASEPNRAKSFSSEPSQCLCSLGASRTALCDREFSRAEPAARSQNPTNARGCSRTLNKLIRCTVRSRKVQWEPIINMISVFKLRLVQSIQ